MTNNLKSAEVLANVDRAIDPMRLFDDLSGANIESLGAAFREAKNVGQRAWLVMAMAIGLAMEKLPEGKQKIGSLSASFEMHKSRLSRLSRIYSEIIKPRMAEGTADFALPELSWYTAALDSATRLKTSPLKLIELAEERKLADPSFSARQFKDEILGAGADPEGASALAKNLHANLRQISSTPDDVVRALVGSVKNRKELVRLVQESVSVVQKLQEEITRHESAAAPAE